MSALRQTGDLSRMYPAARPMTAGIGSSTPRDPLRISGIEDDWLTDPNIQKKKKIVVKYFLPLIIAHDKVLKENGNLNIYN